MYEQDKFVYNKILKRADIVTLVSKIYDYDCMLRRNRYMGDKSQMLIAGFNGIEQSSTWYPIKYARKTYTAIELIDLCHLK